MLSLNDQRGEALARVLAVARLAGEALGEDDDHAVQRRARAGELDQLDRDVVGQARRAARVEAQLDRRRHLVDVLPARPGGADKILDDLAFVDEEIAGFHGILARLRNPETKSLKLADRVEAISNSGPIRRACSICPLS